MIKKVVKAKDFIHRIAAGHKSPVVAWSGGKDSMAMLNLIRDCGYNFPVIFWREPWQPKKYKFQDKIIADYDLVCYTWHPNKSGFQQNGDEFEIQNQYVFNGSGITCPSGITEPVEGLPWVCSIDMLKRPKQFNMVSEWDSVFVGHKACDSDPILGGDVGTRVDAKIGAHATLAFPLRDWSHDDVWQYIEEYNVPWDSDRYEKVDGKFREKSDRSRNVDYVHACTKCVDSRPDAPKRVFCPKFNGIIENRASSVPWYPQEGMLAYMKD